MRKFTIIIFVLVLILSCTETAKEKFEKVKQINTIQAYEQYIVENKNSEYKDEAIIEIQRLDFLNFKTVDELKSFIEKYPDGNFIKKANLKIDSLKKVEKQKIKEEQERKKAEIRKLRQEKRKRPWFVASECIVNYFKAGMKWRMTGMQKIKMTDILSKKLPKEMDMEGSTMNHRLAGSICNSYKITNTVRKMSASDFKRTFTQDPEFRPIWNMVYSAYRNSK